MGKTAIIAVIPKDFSNAAPSMEKSLREKGYSMAPGTFKLFLPYRELSGKRRTGLDPDAQYIKNIKDQAAREAEIERVTRLRNWLQEKTGLDLSPTSKYWDSVSPYKLSDGDNVFVLEEESNIYPTIAFSWLRVYPTIASSLEAYGRGEYPHETHFYVKDTEVESKLLYDSKKEFNAAIFKVDSFDLGKRRKIARLLGLPIGEDTKEEVVYNALDNFLREPAVKIGPYKGQKPVKVFNFFADLKDNELMVKDLIEQALTDNIYRTGTGGKIMEGETVVFENKVEMTKFFLDDRNQKDLLTLQNKIKLKRQIEV